MTARIKKRLMARLKKKMTAGTKIKLKRRDLRKCLNDAKSETTQAKRLKKVLKPRDSRNDVSGETKKRILAARLRIRPRSLLKKRFKLAILKIIDLSGAI